MMRLPAIERSFMPVVTFWINAFIPRNVPGYTQRVPAGPHAGKTAVPLPGVARTWPGNTFKDWDAGYLTDQRDFSDAPAASVRMQSLVEVDATAFAMVRQAHRSAGTTEVNLKSGKQTGFDTADMSRCVFTERASTTPGLGLPGAHFAAGRGTTLPSLPGAARSLVLELDAAAGDPLVGMAADIDFVGSVTFTRPVPTSLEVAFEGLIDAFPAYECYASLQGTTKLLFKSAPPAGNTVADLLGSANRPIAGRVVFSGV